MSAALVLAAAAGETARSAWTGYCTEANPRSRQSPANLRSRMMHPINPTLTMPFWLIWSKTTG
jgi:hypothetical protein